MAGRWAFLFCIALVGVVTAEPLSVVKSFTLKKDEVAKVMIKSEGQERLLTFRWTLYRDQQLVVHESFDRFVGQHVLNTGYTNQSFRKTLLPSKKTVRDIPYALVMFKKFDEASKSAQLDLFIIDKEKRINLDYLTK